jgi:ferrous iron transport protein B
LFIHTWERTWQYMKKAGTVILGISILIWAMMTYPGLPDTRMHHYDSLRQEARQTLVADEAGLKKALEEIKADEAFARLQHSIGGRIGIALEQVSRYAGIDWRTNIALIGGFAAKEVIVSTLGTAYSLGEADPKKNSSLQERLSRDPNWNPVVALAVLAFIMFYAPCLVTVVCIARESGSWKWAAFSILFNTLFAYALAVTIYQIGILLYPH